VSARNNLIVPQSFTAYQAEHISRPDLFERLSNREVSVAKLTQFGTFGQFKFWKRTEYSFVHPKLRVARGYVLKHGRETGFDKRICELMQSEMALRPSWSMSET